jgi:hypothetical protein
LTSILRKNFRGGGNVPMSMLILKKVSKRRGEPKEGGVIVLRRPSQSLSWRIIIFV